MINFPDTQFLLLQLILLIAITKMMSSLNYNISAEVEVKLPIIPRLVNEL